MIRKRINPLPKNLVQNTMLFEKKFQSYCKAKQSVSVNSGTAALHLALACYDLKDKEVILPSLSFGPFREDLIASQDNSIVGRSKCY